MLITMTLTKPPAGTDENLRDTEISWIYRLKQDPDFVQRSIDRWAELRRDAFTPEKVLSRVDALRTQLQESQERNYRKWSVLGRSIKPNYYVGPTYDAEVNWMKLWIKDRIAWLDRQYPVAPKFSEKAGTLTGSGDIFYTLDGSDPRAPGGAMAKAARKYDGPLKTDADTKVFARVRRGSVWSAPMRSGVTAAARSN